MLVTSFEYGNRRSSARTCPGAASRAARAPTPYHGSARTGRDAPPIERVRRPSADASRDATSRAGDRRRRCCCPGRHRASVAWAPASFRVLPLERQRSPEHQPNASRRCDRGHRREPRPWENDATRESSALERLAALVEGFAAARRPLLLLVMRLRHALPFLMGLVAACRSGPAHSAWAPRTPCSSPERSPCSSPLDRSPSLYDRGRSSGQILRAAASGDLDVVNHPRAGPRATAAGRAGMPCCAVRSPPAGSPWWDRRPIPRG